MGIRSYVDTLANSYYSNCVFQYVDHGDGMKDNHTLGTLHKLKKNYLISFDKNYGEFLFSRTYATSHCDWRKDSDCLTSNPRIINSQIIDAQILR